MPNSSINNYEGLPLFEAISAKTCGRCFGTRIFLSPVNTIESCSAISDGNHPQANEAALILLRSVNSLVNRQIWIDPKAFDLARLLTNFTSANPCPRQEIFDTFYDDFLTNNALRKFHALIEELRSIWLLPIGSRKNEPSGYWIITDITDFKEWFDRVKAAPITQLSTIHKVARHNFPVFAEQMELNFWTDLKTEDK